MKVLICPKFHEIWRKSIQSSSFWKQSLPYSKEEMFMRRWDRTWSLLNTVNCHGTFIFPFHGTDPRCQGLKYFFVLPFKNSFFSEKELSQLLLWYLCLCNTWLTKSDWKCHVHCTQTPEIRVHQACGDSI